MNILLLYPEFPDTFWSFKHALKFIRKKASFPPLGLLTVAAMLPPEWSKRLVDVNVTRLTNEDLEWADYAFISSMVIQRKSAQHIIRRCKDAGVRVVAGGPLFTSEQEQFVDVDHFVLNEAELTLTAFLEDVKNNCARRVYTTSHFADIRKTPTPLWALADLRQYASMSIQYTRGCPYHCEFCNVTSLFGRRTRNKTSEQIIAELNSFYNLGWRGPVFFVDDNFIGNKKSLKEDLLPALIKWQQEHVPIPFNTEVSINLADDEYLMQMMYEAGFDTVFVGIETPDTDSLAECNKKQNKNRNLIEDVRRIQRAGLQVQAGFIVGFDSDTPSIFQRQIDFIQKSGIVSAMIGLLQAPAGTKLYERLKKEGRLLGQMSGDNVDGTTNIVPIMDMDTFREGYKSILKYIYSPENYYQRIKTFFREYRVPKIKTRFEFNHIVALFRVICHIGIFGNERAQFWKLLLWTCFHRRELLPLSITLAVYGYHFRKVSELHIL
ncbi:MAG: B12-binding domain-containing radical SAM protein [Candidatus Loosdrechtia sp.]|uniref:B12-binding domain-containing radical SAM protein n=1 Tax=Candidatus Loosdrechtia sp. TaxID=3101272 RepID=UPI003A710D56|nr:MAG: B12-binding domain-containing radical SAM protein [Candidatus Jettenia sp. AMX2]